MSEFYTVSQYAKIKGKDVGNIRRLLIKGLIPGEKIGNQWLIPKEAEYPQDGRIKSGNYRNWRGLVSLRKNNPDLMRALSRLSDDISKIYGSSLKKIILYGSYARGEQTEESDVDVALIIDDEAVNDEKKHDTMVDAVVEYELEQGVTLSVVPISYGQYGQMRRILPFLQNIDKDGIVLWKEV